MNAAVVSSSIREAPPSTPQYFTVRQFAAKHPAFSEGGLRWLLFNRETNGLKNAVKKVGRRVLINEEAFFSWVESTDSA